MTDETTTLTSMITRTATGAAPDLGVQLGAPWSRLQLAPWPRPRSMCSLRSWRRSRRTLAGQEGGATPPRPSRTRSVPNGARGRVQPPRAGPGPPPRYRLVPPNHCGTIPRRRGLPGSTTTLDWQGTGGPCGLSWTSMRTRGARRWRRWARPRRSKRSTGRSSRWRPSRPDGATCGALWVASFLRSVMTSCTTPRGGSHASGGQERACAPRS